MQASPRKATIFLIEMVQKKPEVIFIEMLQSEKNIELLFSFIEDYL